MSIGILWIASSRTRSRQYDAGNLIMATTWDRYHDATQTQAGPTGVYDSATGLYYASARWYNPAVGQFTSQDPTGFAAGDANLYRYVGDNPATMTDPWGLSGGGGGEDTGTWDPGDVSPLMPMPAAGTPNEGPMVTEMGLNVPSPLMPMIAPDAPFEGPMVNEIGTNVPSQLMPMIAPDTPFEGPMVNEIGASTIPHYTGELRYLGDGWPAHWLRQHALLRGRCRRNAKR